VVDEVRSLVEERVEHEGGDAATTARALEALGPPETLAAKIEGEGFAVSRTLRRTFVRTLASVFAAHAMLAIVLSAIPGHGALVPGLVGPLPRESVFATVAGLFGILFCDLGFLVALFAVLGRDRAQRLPTLRLRMPGTRRDGALSLVLIALVAVLLHPLRSRVFAVEGTDGVTPIFPDEVVALLPLFDAMLGLFALRGVLLLAGGRERVESVAADALAALCGAVLAGMLLTRDQLVTLPASLGKDQGLVLEDLLRRAFLVAIFVCGVGLAIRFAKRVLRLRELVARA
jgi:hypothetical protein